MKNKITVLASLASISFIDNSFAQNDGEEAKDNLGRPLVYCKDYMMRTEKEKDLIEVKFYADNNGYYLIKTQNALLDSKPENSFQFLPKDENKNECGSSVHFKDLFSIAFKNMNDNNKYLTYEKWRNIRQSYYYNGREKFPEFYLQKTQEKGYNLVNISNESILNCFRGDYPCNSILKTKAKNDSITSFEFIALEKDGECEQNNYNCAIAQKIDEKLVKLDKEVIQPNTKILDEKLVKFDKEVIQPNTKILDEKLVKLDKEVIQPNTKILDEKLVKLDKEVIQPLGRDLEELGKKFANIFNW